MEKNDKVKKINGKMKLNKEKLCALDSRALNHAEKEKDWNRFNLMSAISPRYFPFCSVSRVLIFISGGNIHPLYHDFNRKAGNSELALNFSLIFIRSSSVNMANLNRKQGK